MIKNKPVKVTLKLRSRVFVYVCHLCQVHRYAIDIAIASYIIGLPAFTAIIEGQQNCPLPAPGSNHHLIQ